MQIEEYRGADTPDDYMNPYRYLNFSDALQVLKQGFAVVRKAWKADERYIELADNRSFVQHESSGIVPYIMTTEDIMADDWYIVTIIDGVIPDNEEEEYDGFPETSASLTLMRSVEDVQALQQEAWNRVWLCESKPVDDPEIEARRYESYKSLIDQYDDLSPILDRDGTYAGFTTKGEEVEMQWYYDFWESTLAVTNWVLGEEKWVMDT